MLVCTKRSNTMC